MYSATESSEGCPNSQQSPRCRVSTSDLRGAGTDANVTLSIKGSKGFLSDTVLESDKNNFERNRTDEFCIQSRDLGVLQSITIGHDGSGFGCAWYDVSD